MKLPHFWKNVMTVVLGATGAQALPLLVAPLLTRMCTPAEMGAFSAWLGVITVGALAATLRIENVIVLERELPQQRLCLGVVAWSTAALAALLPLLALAARLLDLPFMQKISWPALLGLGVGIWLSANFQTMLSYASSHNLFARAAQAKMWKAGTIAVGQAALLYSGAGGVALLAGQLIGLCTGLWAARRLLKPPKVRFRLALDRDQRQFLWRHQAFWRFSLPSSLLNSLVGQLPLFMIGIHHGAEAAGLFALTQRVLAAPISLVAASILEVFKRQAVQEFQTTGNCRKVYRATFRALILLGLPPSLALFLFSPQLFGWVFGTAWEPAGELMRILAPLCLFTFVAGPLSYVFFITGKQKMELRWQLALFAMTIAVFGARLPLFESVAAYSVGRSLLYVVYLGMSYRCALNRGKAAGSLMHLPAAPQASPAKNRR